jgi:hypothetical protein
MVSIEASTMVSMVMDNNKDRMLCNLVLSGPLGVLEGSKTKKCMAKDTQKMLMGDGQEDAGFRGV